MACGKAKPLQVGECMNPTGWIGAVLVLGAIYFVGQKNRWGHLMGAVGEVFWVLYAYHLGSWELGLMGAIYMVVYLRNFWKWSHGELVES